MTRTCECGCGVEFTPRKSTGRFASSACRVRWNRAQKRGLEEADLVADATVVAIAGRRNSRKPSAPATVGSVVAALRKELGSAIDSTLGQQALVLAERIDKRVDTSGSAVAALSKQLIIVTAAAHKVATPEQIAVDPVAAVQAQVIAIRQQANAG